MIESSLNGTPRRLPLTSAITALHSTRRLRRFAIHLALSGSTIARITEKSESLCLVCAAV